MDTEEFWCLVGDRVQTHFLYHTSLTKDQFKKIKKKIIDSEKE